MSTGRSLRSIALAASVTLVSYMPMESLLTVLALAGAITIRSCAFIGPSFSLSTMESMIAWSLSFSSSARNADRSKKRVDDAETLSLMTKVMSYS